MTTTARAPTGTTERHVTGGAVIALLRQTAVDWYRHRCISKGAALAFYALFSLAPVLVLVIALAGLVFGPEAATGEIVRQFRGLIGKDGAEAVQAVIRGADDAELGLLASSIAVVVLVIGSTTAFAELKESLDEIWSEQGARREGLLGALHDRLLSFGLVLVLAFLLLVSLLINAALALMADYWGSGIGASVLTTALSSFVTLLVITALFAAIFKLLPPARLGWRDVAMGAVLTASLFEVGKYLIGLYLGNAAITSTFGAAGALGVLALWVYFSAQIFFFGAEFTRLYACQHGSLRNTPTTKRNRRHENRDRPPAKKARVAAH
jgi:membrane protein